MSPLIDVTNTALGLQVESSNTRSVKPQRACVRGPDVNQQSKASKRGLPERVRAKNEAVAIRMCNTWVSGPAGDPAGDSVKSGADCPVSLSPATQCPTDEALPRVPPLPQSADALLSQAVQALSLSPPSSKTRTRARRRLSRHRTTSQQEHDKQASDTVVLSCSSSGLPENSQESVGLSTPKQCGACGLEFTSTPVLTQHLVRHVYDGLYAAQWLTQAMGLVSNNRQSGEGPSQSVFTEDTGESNASQVPQQHSQTPATGH
ncbi:uncharacterized protein LOC122247883 [Penaeus japonicus]|uniref:uncharacterized protein LOC122247883 n=1 Tax=Penaeus japonicus TaxID=27405 RepID=UPI001C710CE1|nr:uncharacterized protein LOC122247883 [Penaeus japonicus]XP_042863509.1 uncharacterized protein LOC122247883 [Penaeus japonicus]